MNLFLNYNADTNTVLVNTFIKVGGYHNDDVRGLVDDILNGDNGCCPLDGALDAIRDGSLWDGSHQEALEMIDSAICEFYDNN